MILELETRGGGGRETDRLGGRRSPIPDIWLATIASHWLYNDLRIKQKNDNLSMRYTNAVNLYCKVLNHNQRRLEGSLHNPPEQQVATVDRKNCPAGRNLEQIDTDR